MANILVLFETSGAVSVPFRNAGHTVITIDILPHKINNDWHIQGDINDLFEEDFNFAEFDLLIAFPPCTYFSKAGLHWLNKQLGRKAKQLKDLELIKKLWATPIPLKCFENPQGSALNKLWQISSQTIDYANFADFKKKTDLWLQGLPPLMAEFLNYKNYGSFITKMPYNSYKRNITPIELGYSMVKQWGYLLQ